MYVRKNQREIYFKTSKQSNKLSCSFPSSTLWIIVKTLLVVKHFVLDWFCTCSNTNSTVYALPCD